jgi:hypothetical protein
MKHFKLKTPIFKGHSLPPRHSHGADYFPEHLKRASPSQKRLMADLVLFLRSNDDVMELDYDTMLKYNSTTGRVVIISEGSLMHILNYADTPDAEVLSGDIMDAFTKIGKRYGYEWDMVDHVTIGFYPVE